MRLSNLVSESAMDRADCAVMVNTYDPLRTSLWRMSVEAPDVFTAFLSVHRAMDGGTLKRHRHFLCFVPFGSLKMRFAGLWNVEGVSDRPAEMFDRDLRFRRLHKEWNGPRASDYCHKQKHETRRYFDVTPSPYLDDLTGTIEIDWPDQPRTYIRSLTDYDPAIRAKETRWWP
ncbi:hypothetical protein [Pseudoroseicyclus aestuarii]|uniref:Uncharacterized protein n=1 Tax=Pseudoroseicyclus aestuarii TaxID=1795041 RepID=A0A318SPS1_9RHOB|nr:hypothetical protein [Pseudoroseicyclus aestuarii]PYE83870.1 hypothetical protein DFP88_103231 [Pseudoroseicyclus aestuarii]